MEYRQIVVPVDLSQASVDALSYALALAPRKRIEVLHVSSPSSKPEIVWGREDDRHRLEDKRFELGVWLDSHGFRGMRTAELVGEPSTTVVDFAEKIDADLIIMPSRRRTGLSRLLLGSVAEWVVRHAKCPVLVLQGETWHDNLPKHDDGAPRHVKGVEQP